MQQRIPRRETRKDGYKDKSRVLGVGCSIKLRVLGLSRGGVVRVTLGRVVRVSRGPTHSLSSSCELTAMCMHLNSSLLHNLSLATIRASCSVILFCSRVGEVAAAADCGGVKFKVGGYPFPPHSATGNWQPTGRVQQPPPSLCLVPAARTRSPPLPSTSSSSSSSSSSSYSSSLLSRRKLYV